MCQSLSSTHDAARGLFRRRGSGLLSMSHADLSARELFPLLDASASRFVEATLFFFPPQGEICFPPCHLRRRRRESRRFRTSYPKLLCDRGHPRPPWPSSWPSSLAPGKAPEPASLSEEGWLVPLAAELDTYSAPLSLSTPENITSGF